MLHSVEFIVNVENKHAIHITNVKTKDKKDKREMT